MIFNGRRILVVEDQFLVALATIDLLESLGCEVLGPATSVSDALRLVKSETLDAAVLDINLAGEVVWPVAAELQTAGVPFLFLSALTRLIKFPEPFAAAPRLTKLVQGNLLLSSLYGILRPEVDSIAAADKVALSG